MSLATGGAGRHDEPGDARWRLCRAGIVNVYQYEHEVLHFGGGRLLLRGVNGSGKSTAMNMLLPFLLTARQGQIDAAGEQAGVLKSWMLSGRDDPQPVGYLWIEFERGGRHLTCGCGIKANRQSDTVTTWWFVTGQRPDIDLHLVEGGAALTADALRAVLDGEPVFPENRRRDYRAEVERRLFGGTSIDQHVGLLNIVRNPRIGDRIDLELPGYLRDALPQLSDQALAEAAQPLDDLEDHRHNVAELEQTREAIDGLLKVYRDYCAHDLHARVELAREQAEGAATLDREVATAGDRAARAVADVGRLRAEVERLEQEEGRLRSEIDALRASPAYQSGQELEDVRKLVRQLADEAGRARKRLEESESAAEGAFRHLADAERVSRDDLAQLNQCLATIERDTSGCGLTERGPGPLAIDSRHLDGTERTEPATELDPGPASAALTRVRSSLAQRRLDVAEVTARRDAVDEAETQLRGAERELALAETRATVAAQRRDESLQALAASRGHWRELAGTWTADLHRQASAAGHDPALGDIPLDDVTEGERDEDGMHAELLGAADSLLAWLEERLAGAGSVLGRRQEDEDEARAAVDELAARTEPDTPRPSWQTPGEHVLADLVDFAPHLGADERAGLEGALEASGLLSARIGTDGSAELASGELVAVVSAGVAAPLTDLLTVTVPDHLAGDVDPGLVAKLLDSISHDPATGAATAVAADGSFRVGALRGRHAKGTAEHVGATARRAALERARELAAQRLEAARTALGAATEAHRAATAARDDARLLRAGLPTTSEIQATRSAFGTATRAADGAEEDRQQAADQQREAERAFVAASDDLQRTASSLVLPQDTNGLDRVARSLLDLEHEVAGGENRLTVLVRSIDTWRSWAGGWREARDRTLGARDELTATENRHGKEAARLATIEDSVGAEYAEVLDMLDQCQTELTGVGDDLVGRREAHTGAVGRQATADTQLHTVTERRDAAEGGCEEARRELTSVLGLPGVLAALGSDDDGTDGGRIESPVVADTGSTGLRSLAAAVAALLPPRPAEPVTADGVHMSLRRRRDTLGAGWDAEARQPDPARPLTVEVNGPSGKAPLALSARSVADQHRQLAGLLNAKQDAALRELLQGLIAREVAEKVHGASTLVGLMNDRLGTVATAHDIGVRLRWRRSAELDEPTARMVELLATLPDLRTEDDERELRALLSARLDQARREQPDVPYRQLIASTLDYRQWHDLTVLLRRGDRETPLGRRTQLSEGEKKLVTYLPMFAAVAASCDALAEQAAAPGGPPAPLPRFVLLDDAFAKVSEDNHAKLFGLLVDLDLDLIATSERLWGTHRSVPELAITEVVRDASAGVILLEHYRWDGHTLEHLGPR